MLSNEEYLLSRHCARLKAQKIYKDSSDEMRESFLKDEELLHKYEMVRDKELRPDCVDVTLDLDKSLYLSLAAAARRRGITTNEHLEKALEKTVESNERKPSIFDALFNSDLESKDNSLNG